MCGPRESYNPCISAYIYINHIIPKNGVFHESNWWLAIYPGIELSRMYKKWHHFKEHPGEVFATWGPLAKVPLDP